MSSTIDEGGPTTPRTEAPGSRTGQPAAAPELLYELFKPADTDAPPIAPAVASAPKTVPVSELEPIPVPPEFAPERPIAQPSAPPGTEPAPEPAKHAAPPAAGPASSTNATWREAAPYEETGILIRPADWSTDRIETALINVGTLRKELREEDAPQAGRRRTGIRRLIPTPRRGILLGILLLQALLSLRNNNTAFEDEALYLYSGHLELAHLLFHQPIDDFASYFSGAPVLYPIAGAIADQVGGLFGARLLSLAFMLGATGLVYLTGRRLFGVRSALVGAGLFGTTASAVFVGALATYDAPSVFLLALAAWIVVRGASSSWPYYVIAVLPMILAVGTKYASLLFLPTIVALACISALPYHGWRWAAIRPVALTALIASMAYGALKLAGPSYSQGIRSTTTSRAQGGTSTQTMLIEIAKWAAPVFVAACVGGYYYVFRHRPDVDSRLRLGRLGRAALTLLLLGTALLAPANQLRLHTDVSLQKHVGFGLLFAAPLAGYGVIRLVGSHWGRVQLGIGVAVVAFGFGMSQSHIMFRVWSNTDQVVAALKQYQQPGAHYLVEVDEVPIYYLRGDTSAEPSQFASTFVFRYLDWQGQWLTGNQAYQTAVAQGYFQVVVINGATTPDVDHAILASLHAPTSQYRLAKTINEPTVYGNVAYQVWVKKPGTQS
jgi:MFS family permease